MQDAIVAHDLGKRFRLRDRQHAPTLQAVVQRGFRGLSSTTYLWAVRDASLAVAPGRALALVGRNGAGKSTLLRLLGGVLRPDEGRVRCNGRVGALLDLGAGLHDELTGRENVYLRGVVGGRTRREVAAAFDAIVAFAELESCIDRPMRTYSTGMRMRLALSVSIHARPSIFLIDEALAVGDAGFRRKVVDRVTDLKRDGCAIVFVSHDEHLVATLCDDAMWLDAGRVVAEGDAADVVGRYHESMLAHGATARA